MTPLNEEEQEDLVAFLDGEVDALGEEKVQAIETRLNLDSAVRTEADALKRTWDLLDYLPRPEASSSFTHRTLDRLSTRETQQALRKSRRRRWLAIPAWAAAVLIAAWAGHAAVSSRIEQSATEEREQHRQQAEQQRKEQDLVTDLRLIENLRFYEAVDTLEMLDALDHPDLFGEDPLDS